MAALRDVSSAAPGLCSRPPPAAAGVLTPRAYRPLIGQIPTRWELQPGTPAPAWLELPSHANSANQCLLRPSRGRRLPRRGGWSAAGTIGHEVSDAPRAGPTTDRVGPPACPMSPAASQFRPHRVRYAHQGSNGSPRRQTAPRIPVVAARRNQRNQRPRSGRSGPLRAHALRQRTTYGHLDAEPMPNLAVSSAAGQLERIGVAPSRTRRHFRKRDKRTTLD